MSLRKQTAGFGDSVYFNHSCGDAWILPLHVEASLVHDYHMNAPKWFSAICIKIFYRGL